MIAKRIVMMLAVLGLAACTADSQKAPSPSGPSGFGVALSVTASPDILVRDGQAQSRIDVTLSDASGASVANRTIHFFVSSGGGTLSAASAKTDTAGKVSVTYTAPAAGPAQTVVFTATLEGSNFVNASHGSVAIQLVQPPV